MQAQDRVAVHYISLLGCFFWGGIKFNFYWWLDIRLAEWDPNCRLTGYHFGVLTPVSHSDSQLMSKQQFVLCSQQFEKWVVVRQYIYIAKKMRKFACELKQTIKIMTIICYYLKAIFQSTLNYVNFQTSLNCQGKKYKIWKKKQ